MISYDWFRSKSEWSTTFLRWGLALSLIQASVIKFMNPNNKVVDLFNNLVGFGSTNIITIIGVLMLASAISLIVGWQVRSLGILYSIFFMITIISGLIQSGKPIISAGPAIWKDFALLGISIALILTDPGKLSVDKE